MKQPDLSLTITSNGKDLGTLSKEGPVLLIFLRHFGCVFCKEAMNDISKKRSEWSQKGIEVVLVHMSDSNIANDYFNKFGLQGVTNISDPTCKLYSKFGLAKGSASQLLGLKNWIRGFEVAASGVALPTIRQIGDGFQMPGMFLIHDNTIKDSFIHKSAADRPDYDSLINCCKM